MREPVGVGLLALALAAQLAWGVAGDGITTDELLYIASGYRHLTASDYRLNPTTPPLAKLVGALGLLGLPLRVADVAAGPAEWSWSFRFIQEDNAEQPILLRARIMGSLLTLLLALFVWGWARSRHGPAAGLSALALFAFHPSFLAHGHLMTTDVAGTLTFLAGTWAYGWWSRAASPRRAALVGFAFGLAVTARLTGFLLGPTLVVLELLRWLRAGRAGRRAVARQALSLAATLIVIVPLVIWALHGFHYAPWPDETVAQAPGPWLGAAGRFILGLEQAHVLPESYLEGMRYQVEHNLVGHPAYLLGRLSNTGWPHYYLVAFLVKNTPGFLLGVAVAAWALWRRRRTLGGGIELEWLVPAALVFVAASAGHIQIGERYILPAYPYLILLIASSAPALLARQRALAVALLALHAGPALLAAPRGYLTYFNALAGGADGGHRVLLDSNLDWGQDLPRLAAWMKARGVAGVQLGYHGSDDPKRYGIRHEDLPGLNLYSRRPAEQPFRGTIAVSPNMLMGLFHPPGRNPYAALAASPPADRAGALFLYRVP